MAIDPTNVTTGTGRRGGYVFRSELGLTLPTDATTALPANFINQGAASNDGFTQSIDRSFEIIRDQRGDEMLRVATELSVPASIALIETASAVTAQTIFGEDAVTVDLDEDGEHGSIVFKGAETDPSAWVLDLAHGRNLRRFVFPHAQMVTESFERELTNSQELRYPVELSMRPDENGAYFYEYWTNGYKRVGNGG